MIPLPATRRAAHHLIPAGSSERAAVRLSIIIIDAAILSTIFVYPDARHYTPTPERSQNSINMVATDE